MLAGSGTGKTTFCKEVIYSLLMQGKRVGMVCLEESNRRTLLGLVGIHLSKNLLVDRSQATDAEVVEAFDDLFADRTCVLLDHFGSNDINTIEARVRYMCSAHGAEAILIDHVSMLVSGNEGDDRKNLDVAMTRLRTLCAELSVSMLLVSHLSRPSGDRGHEAGAAISLSQARLARHRSTRRLYRSAGRPGRSGQRRTPSPCLEEPMVRRNRPCRNAALHEIRRRLAKTSSPYCNKNKNKKEQHMALRPRTTLPPKMRREVDIFVEDYQPHHGEIAPRCGSRSATQVAT